MKLLNVENLTKIYPSFRLDGVTISLDAGKILGLVGKNGAGKSTFLKCVTGLVPKSGGLVEMFGKDFTASEREIKQSLGVVFGGVNYYLNAKLSAVTDAARKCYAKWDEDAFRRYCSAFDLDPRKRVKELSDGMRVKFAVAMALSRDAKLFLFDEPTSGLDPVSRDDLLNLFKSLIKDGKRSVLFSTHITSDLEKCADEIAYLHQGKLLAHTKKDRFSDAFRNLLKEGETALSIEDIMIRTEKKNYDQTFAL